MTNASHAAQLRKLNRLNRAELAALIHRDFRMCPNHVHLTSALAKLEAP